jgi:hypothetical protein
MARTNLFRLLGTVVPALVMGAGLVLASAPAGAVNPGPIQIPLRDPGPINCPAGTFVTTNPGPQQSPSFVLVNPGPINCPAGIDVLRNPGPVGTPQGQAVSLPLSATDCAAGTALIDSELSLLGLGPGGIGSGPPPASDPCPSGDAALAALGAALANVPVAPPGSFGFKNPGPLGTPGGFVLVNPGPTQAPAVGFAYLLDATGTPNGVWVEKNPGPNGFQLLVLAPSGTPGVSVLRNPGPQG